MSSPPPSGRRRDTADLPMHDLEGDREETPPEQRAPSEEELAYRTDLITIEAQQHLDGWEEDDLKLFLELLEDASSELQRELLNRALSVGHSPSELHSFADSIRSLSDEAVFRLCTPAEDTAARTREQMEIRLRAEADPILAFRLHRAPPAAAAPPALPPEPKTQPAEVLAQAVQHTAKAGLKVPFNLSQSYDGTRPIAAPPGLPAAAPAAAAPAGVTARESGEKSPLRPRPAAPAVRLPPALMVEARPAPVQVPVAPPPPAAAPAAAEPKKEPQRKAFADDLFNEALRPFGITVEEVIIDDANITVQKLLPLATEALLKGIPVPVILGNHKGDHRRYALMLQVVISEKARIFQIHDPFAQETAWINDADLLGLNELNFNDKYYRRLTAMALPRGPGGRP